MPYKRTSELSPDAFEPTAVISEIITCPICTGTGCMKESSINRSVVDGVVVEEVVDSYLCMECGFTTTSDMEVGSEFYKTAIDNSPKLVLDLSVADNLRNIVWFPSVINVPQRGVCYPDGTPEEWEWVVSPYVELTEEDKKKFSATTGKDMQYSHRLAVENATRFPKTKFSDALASLQIIITHGEK